MAERHLPEGTVTFVFTDVEGSTRRVSELGDAAWADLLADHDQLLRPAFEDEGGLVVNTEGDALFVVFPVAADAVRAAVAAQRALEAHHWPAGGELRVRMGVHTGAALVRDGDYVGAEVHRASRIADTGHGGQIVVSEAAAALARPALPASVELVDQGLHRLKDLTEPQRLFSLRATGLPSRFPPLRSLEGTSNNLPVQRSPLIGRAAEIARTRELVEAHRLITLTGVGGTGKTRLALQVAAEELDRHRDGVFFVDLAPLTDPDRVAASIADAVGVQLGGPRRTTDLLVEALSGKNQLLVIDNCEHLLDACCDVLDRILLTCPEVRLLATSREPLEVEGEQVYRVPSLSLPDADSALDVAARSEAVNLFVSRAQSVDPDFELTGENASDICQICRRLDGIPLAIEFAAARVAHLAPGDIATRLDNRFGLLTGGRQRVRRQKTLEAALDWSHDLLEEPERLLLRRLGIFAGSFGLTFVEQVCTGDPEVDAVAEDAVIDLLGALVSKSLVTTETVDGHVRYRLLETVRGYAQEKLHDAGESETYRSRHRDACLAWLESLTWEQLYADPDTQASVLRELDNLRVALQWSHQQGRHDLVGRLAARLVMLWQPGEGYGEEGAQWIRWALEEPSSLRREEQAACLLALAMAGMTLGNAEWEHHAARAVELGGEPLGGPLVIAHGVRAVGVASRSVATGDPEVASLARRVAGDGLGLARELGGRWVPMMLVFHGQATALLGDLEGAERSFAEATEGTLSPSFHDIGCAELATCRAVLGDPRGAREAAELALGNGSSSFRQRPSVHLSAALAAAAAGSLTDAAMHLRDAMAVTSANGIVLERNECMVYAAAVAGEAGHRATAARLLVATLNVGDAPLAPTPFRTPASYIVFQHHLQRVQASLPAEALRRHGDEASGWTLDQAWDAVESVADQLDGGSTRQADRDATS